MSKATRRRIMSRQSVKSIFYVLAGAAGFLVVFLLIHLPHGPEHWSADLRTAYLSPRLETQHPRIALIEVTEKTLEKYPYTAPINRQLLADIVRTVDAAGPTVIGLDFLFDRPTVSVDDNNLIQTIREARTPIVMGSLANDTLPTPNQREFQSDFLRRANRPAGHLYFDEHHNSLMISDHVVRFLELENVDQSYPQSFSELLAIAAGAHQLPRSRYISWLSPPKDGTEVFLTLSAEHVLGQGGLATALPLSEMFHDKVVLIGGNVSDRDRHLIPLSVIDGSRFPGLFIHAQILAQILDQRSLRVLSEAAEVILALVFGVVGFWIGRRTQLEHYHLFAEFGGVASLIVLSVILFMYASLIFPFISAFLAWVASMTAGQFSRWAKE